MKTFYKQYVLKKSGKVLNVALGGIVRALGGEDVTTGDVPVDVLDGLGITIVSPNHTGALLISTDESKPCHYVIDGNVLAITLSQLADGVHRVYVRVRYGTNIHTALIADLTVPNRHEEGMDDPDDIELTVVDTFGDGACSVEFKSDAYADAAGRVIVERTEDGGTLVLDEHENPILKRNADGTTEVYDAYQSGRVAVSANGGVTINSGDGEHFVVIGSAVVGATTDTEVGTNALVNGYGCKATGTNSHAEGAATVASGVSAHAEGSSDQTNTCEASGEGSHAEGIGCVASGKCAHAEGYHCVASGDESHAEGEQCTASGMRSHAEGYKTSASHTSCHAEGHETSAYRARSHAEGAFTKAGAPDSHAEGAFAVTIADMSHAEGYYTKTINPGLYSHAQGMWNNAEDAKVAGSFSHGCGTSETDRRNAFLIVGSETYVYGVGGYDGTNHATEGVQSLRQVLSAINLKLVNVPTA